MSIKHTEKRMSRNLSDFDPSDNVRIKENLLVRNAWRIRPETVITLDSWDINKSGALKMENLKKVHDGSTGNIGLGYCLNSIVATNVEYGFEKGKKRKKISNIPLNLNLYSTKAKGFESENRESMKAVDEVIKIIGNTGIWVMDRGYDRSKNIIGELVDRKLAFIIRAVWTRDVARVSDDKKMRLKNLADAVKVRKRIMNFEYRTEEKDKNGDRIKKKISGMVGAEKIRIPGIGHDLCLCVLKKFNGSIAMMITSIEINDNDDIVRHYRSVNQSFFLKKALI